MTISAGQVETHTIPVGKVLRIVTDAVSTGQWRKLLNSSGLPVGLFPVQASKTINLGPYSLLQSLKLECLTGVLTTTMIDVHAEGPGIVVIDRSQTIDANNAPVFNGKTLRFEAAYTLTLAAGLPPGFNFAYVPPASGNASFASDGTVLFNGATTTITKAASDIGGAMVNYDVDAYILK